MNSAEAIEILRDGIYVLLISGAPPLMVALIVGLIISLFQALTQIQEATLTFVPKIIALMFTLIIALPFMFETLVTFSNQLFERIAHMQ